MYGRDEELPADAELPEVVSADGEVVGRVGDLLWRDRSGFDVITVTVAGSEVVVPIRPGPLPLVRGRLKLEFPAGTVLAGPRVGELAVRGGAAAVRHVGDRYHVTLAGPPEGTSTGSLPPWLRPAAGLGESQDSELPSGLE